MGWSCTKKASDTEHKWQALCRKHNNSSNVFLLSEGREAFYEIDKIEFDDGRIVGQIVGMDGYVVSRFRINGDGTIAQAPLALRRAAGEAI